MRIVSLTNTYSVNGGVGTYMTHLHSAWKAAGHESIIIHSDRNAKAGTADSNLHYVEAFDRFSWEGNVKPRTAAVLKILDQVKPDIIHIQNNNNTDLETELQNRAPSVKSMHTYEFCPTGAKFHHRNRKVCFHPTGPLCIPRMIYKQCTLSKRPGTILKLYRNADEVNRHHANHSKIIVYSEFIRQKALESHYPPSQVETVPYFVRDPQDLGPGLYDQNLILFVGRLVPEKGINELIKSVALIEKTVPWTLLIAGDGPEKERLMLQAQQLKLQDRIQFLGWQSPEQIAALYKQAAVLVIPSLWPEPFGIVGLEAMIYAKPVIAFTVGGIPEWLEHDRTGYLIKPYDLREMAGALQSLIENPARAKEMGQNGRISVKQKFSSEVHLKRLLEIYGKVIKNKKRGE